MTDVSFQIKGQSGATQARSGAGDEQERRSHGPQGGAGETDGHDAARSVNAANGEEEAGSPLICTTLRFLNDDSNESAGF